MSMRRLDELLRDWPGRIVEELLFDTTPHQVLAGGLGIDTSQYHRGNLAAGNALQRLGALREDALEVGFERSPFSP
jgi:hypothetical protein